MKKKIRDHSRCRISCKMKFGLSIIGLFLMMQNTSAQHLLNILEYCHVENGAEMTVKGSIQGLADTVDNNGIIKLTGDWINNASDNFLNSTANSGEVEFKSASVNQQIAGSFTTTYYNLTINNTVGDVILYQDIVVDNNLTMIDGDLDLFNSDADLGTSGNIAGETQDHRIKVGDPTADTGTIKAVADINNTTIEPGSMGMEITTTANLGTTTIIRGHKEQQSVNFLDNYSICRYYDIIPATSIDADLKFDYWEIELTEGSVVHNENDLEMFFKKSIWIWKPLLTNINAGSNFATATTDTLMTRFTLADSSGNLMPVELLAFDANWTGNGQESRVKLEWQTASEMNCDYFEIHKCSGTGSAGGFLNWQTIGKTNGKGNSNQTVGYIYYDEYPFPDRPSCYRLKQFDFNGSYEYSEIRTVYPPEDYFELSRIYPKPAEDFINLEFIAGQAKTVYIRLWDNTGRLTLQHKADVKRGANLVKLNIGHLSGAYYTLQAITKDGRYKTEKEIIVQ